MCLKNIIHFIYKKVKLRCKLATLEIGEKCCAEKRGVIQSFYIEYFITDTMIKNKRSD